ncbi:MAG: ABC transporter permease [Candidatus Hodarchaeales archaeon]|jgi:hypothetical protein
MSVRQILSVAKISGLQIIRSKWTVPYLILFPIFFIGLYYVGFSNSIIGSNQTFMLGVVNNDEGFNDNVKTILSNETFADYFPHDLNVIEKGFGYEFSLLLNSTKYSNKTDAKQIFDVEIYNNAQDAQQDLEDRSLDILMVIDKNFSQSLLSAINHYWKITYGYFLHSEFPIHSNTTIEILGDPSNLNYVIAEMVLSYFLNAYQDIDQYFNTPGGIISFEINPETEINLPTYSFFELMSPGLIALGLITTPGLTAMLICREFDLKNPTFDRLKLAPVSTSSYLLGFMIAQIPLFLIQNVILILSALLFGFRPSGSILLGFIVACSIFPFSVTMSIFSAAFFSDEIVAGNVVGLATPVFAFMAGCFLDIPDIVILTNIFPTNTGISRDLLLYDFLPLRTAVNALRDILLYNFTLEDVIFELIACLGLTSLMFTLSIFLFYKRRFTT